MNLADVYGELGAQIDIIPSLRVYPYPSEVVQTPAAVFGFPESLPFDLTYQRGGDRLTVPIHVLVGRVVDRLLIEELGAFTSGSGQQSVKAILEGGSYTAFHSMRVMSATFETFLIGGVELYGATFNVDVVGAGA